MIDPLAEVESLLSRHRFSPVTVVDWQRLEPWAVARARLSGLRRPERVIVKWVRPHPDQTRPESWRFRTELAALRFLSEDLSLNLAPRAIAADVASGLVVLEDLAPRTALDQLLRADGAAAHADRLVAFARARGELNAATAGMAETYYARRTALGPVDPAADRVGRWAGHREEGRRQAAGVGAPITGRAERELAAALEELAEPGPFLTLSNGDPEANNVLVHASGAPDPRLIDFEFAGYTHALNDAVCLHVPGPAWLSVGDAITGGLAAARTAEAHRPLPHLAGWARRMADLLRRRWPDTDLNLTDQTTFPPYAARRS
ncbi:phosphotransferase [Microtetraspora sp. AC03309]|uniref:phosphotransferase n=1 Tax=Microtetraspora sp. AC03309 TaxID=2779376 RepID=UPI001E48DE15|nr:phosphotransferase [Microtetraspora sp. AC03309]MCC5578805.1 phosphotransferase [Microtetraspora sp. AC03309]